MARLLLSLLGPFQAMLDEQPATGFESNKVRALLIYLAVEVDRPHPREVLAGLLWPEWPDREARGNLRYALSNLRQAIGDRDALPPFLLITHDMLQFNAASDHWLDVAAFTELTGLGDPSALEQAVALYRGSFLEGFSVSSAAPFEEWALLKGEQLGRQMLTALYRLAATFEQRGEYERAQPYAWRQVELEPWNEEAHQQLMRLLALRGQRSGALAQYETCRRLLAEELGVEPADETTALYESIRDGTLVAPSFVLPPPAFISTDAEPVEVERPVFVARERELAQLGEYLTQALAGLGRVVFVIGEPGSGKTALVQEFIRRSMDSHADLVAVNGRCNAHTGIGDPYLPFLEISQMLTGDVEARWAAGAITHEHARRLWALLPDAVQALADYGPELIDRFVPSAALLACAQVGAPGQVPRLEDLLKQRAAAATGAANLQQVDLFKQYTRVLQALARGRPLILVVDDLQWADAGSISLLFHLGRRLAGSRILLVGAYRSGDVALGREGERHPLELVIHELQRDLGDIYVDLTQAEGRSFVEALLDSEPNRLDAVFQETLYRHTGGHPLFTVELLRGMQERGDLTRDESGHWIEGTALDWETLPPRVEAVIAERIGRLPEDWQTTLAAASVEGEAFTAEVVARVQAADEYQVLQRLSGPLSKKYRLVHATGVQWLDGKRLSHYRFRHYLFQRSLYNKLDPIERAHLHEAMGSALEALYGERASELAVPLAWHFEAAGMAAKAVGYLLQAGERDIRLSANEEAIVHLHRGLALLERLPETPSRAQQELGLQMALGAALGMVRGLGVPALGRAYARARELCQQVGDTPQLSQAVWGLWRFYHVRAKLRRARKLGEELLSMARHAQDTVFLLEAHLALGATLYYQGELGLAREHMEQGIDLYDPQQYLSHAVLYGQDPVVSCLCELARILWHVGYPDQAVAKMHEALNLAHELAHPLTQAFALANAIVLHWFRREGRAVQQQAQTIAALSTEHGFPQWLAHGRFHLGWARVRQGEVEGGIAQMQRSLAAWRATGTELTRPRFLVELADACAQVGRAEEGLSALAEAQALIEESGEGYYTAELHRLWGELLLMQSSAEADSEEPFHCAETCFRRAIEIARRQQARSWELRAAVSLCRLWRRQGKREEARQLLQPIYDWFSEGFDTVDLREARALLDVLA
ncbi:MAG: AAA family ATPase [Anaerolineae bacterium]|nr:MAG: AAA family ATPase [Anaerolineae bacterium]